MVRATILEKLKKTAKKAPNKPGVYIWRDENKKPLYVGRAGSLHKRVQSYFRTKNSRISEMVGVARSITFEVTDTLLEAIVLEANLIKKYWPKYNVRDKDNKSFIYLVVTADEYPRLLAVRGRELEKYDSGKIKTKAIFGPYQSYWLLRKALEIIRRVFPFSVCSPGAKKPCFHYQIGLCPGVCVGEVDKKEYQRSIRNLILFFRGDKKRLTTRLKKEKPEAIAALAQVNDVALLANSNVVLRHGDALKSRRIEGYDISHLSGKEAVGAMVVFENGEAVVSEYRLFKIRSADSRDDLAMLAEVVSRRLKHDEWQMPDIIFVDGGLSQLRMVNKILKVRNIFLPLVGLAKGGKHAGSAYKTDKLVILNTKKIGKDLIVASKKLFQEVRNEAHRFAIKANRRERSKRFNKKKVKK